MENINKIETELATKLEELGFYVKHADGWISYVHKETCLDGGIVILDNEIRCSLKFRVVGDYLTLLDHKQFSCSKIEELVFLHSAIVEYLTELEKSSMNFYSTMQSTGMTVELNDFGLVIESSLGKFKSSLTVTELSDGSAYRCMGSIYLKDDWYSVELVEVSKTLKSEEEIIYLIQSMTSSCIGIMEYIRKQREFLNL